MTPREELEKQIEDYKELVDLIADTEEYLYNWCQIYTGKYNYVDHSKWPEKCMLLFQHYKFDIPKIKEDIINGTIVLPKYTTNNPKLIALESQLYEKHKEKVEEFEKNLSEKFVKN
jgi:hypothetical protein